MQQNGMRYPSEGTKTRAMWEMFDQIWDDLGDITTDEVAKRIGALGLNVNTAISQVSRWRTYHRRFTLNNKGKKITGS